MKSKGLNLVIDVSTIASAVLSIIAVSTTASAVLTVFAVSTIASAVLAVTAAGTQPFGSSSLRGDRSRVTCVIRLLQLVADMRQSCCQHKDGRQSESGGNHKACIFSGTSHDSKRSFVACFRKRKGLMDMLGQGFTLSGAQAVFGSSFMQPPGKLL